MSPDLINGLFETLGGLFIACSCYRVIQDKQVKGISLWPVLFFNSWGFWNLFFYPAIGAWWSFLGGLGVVTANTIWTTLLIRYKWFYHAPQGNS